ncbi:MAG: phenylacetic acid degradation bifunctional protein PaaZ [Pseudomonadales bacterium]|nr:phenylacetic acid degradation bifunctional protein PaaZ [Pseudomonadales bacterium]NRA17751.1 phenylacetic acid degradation bifunctional protein PaaZ [Oceanospirillaceae bacterium]
MIVQSYACGQWISGEASASQLKSAVTGEVIAEVRSMQSGFEQMLSYAREQAAPLLQQLSIHDRANLLKDLAKHLLEKKEYFYQLSVHTGATKADSWVDIEGGISTLFSYSGIARRELTNEKFIVEGDLQPLSAKGSFAGHHILTSKKGASVHINAFNFPVWGMLEKIAPSLVAGVPVIVKPATVSCYLTEAVVREIVASKILPLGAVQLICGSTGDLLDHLSSQDVITFTGSASTGQMLKNHPNITRNSVPFTMEADSLNACVLGEDVSEDMPEFELFIKEIQREMTTKAGQKCTAIRRVIVPAQMLDKVSAALRARLVKTVIGDPNRSEVSMGALVGTSQCADVAENVALLKRDCEQILGLWSEFKVNLDEIEAGAYYPPTVLVCHKPFEVESVHSIEAFGPVCTLMPYSGNDQAVQLMQMGGGSLVASVFSFDHQIAFDLIHRGASHHGRMLLLNRESAKESTGHGSPMPSLVHGGPGRAGGGEELGGIRAIKHYMQRTAIQGSPNSLMALTKEYQRGADRHMDLIHPFRKNFDQLCIGDALKTHRRTVTEADIVNFGCLSGDHFYAHFDEIAAADSFFGKRVAHGYFVISAAAGLFVDPGVGPVIANYGIDNLRFIEPVGIGDTIQVTLTAKRKVKKVKREDEDRHTGIVIWDVEVHNQHQELVALYDILTLVERAKK